MLLASNWQDYELIDAGAGEKLERWGEIIMARPDPQAIWPKQAADGEWRKADMVYHRSSSGGGYWQKFRTVPEAWEIGYDSNDLKLKFRVKPTDFKHMGLFPEQAVNWNWVSNKIKSANRKNTNHPVRILNLFAYTGGATIACISAGADVTHVDAAKGMNGWAGENIKLSGLQSKPHRIITDDVIKYVRREKRRGSFYDGVIMDPPAFGRGPGGEIWKLEERLFELALAVSDVLTAAPMFVLLNSYTAGLSPAAGANILKIVLPDTGSTAFGEIGLPAESGVVLPCGSYARWEAL
jgi:23S rRNA (cytosine1962-C5)-methyltransferase